MTGTSVAFAGESAYAQILHDALAPEGIHVAQLIIPRSIGGVSPITSPTPFDHLEESRKERAFGVSNHTPRQIDLQKTTVRQPIVANQVQLSITHSTIIAQGLSSNMTGVEDSITRDGGGLADYSRINGITVQAWRRSERASRAGSSSVRPTTRC